jgi:hypothetical protein
MAMVSGSCSAVDAVVETGRDQFVAGGVVGVPVG